MCNGHCSSRNVCLPWQPSKTTFLHCEKEEIAQKLKVFLLRHSLYNETATEWWWAKVFFFFFISFFQISVVDEGEWPNQLVSLSLCCCWKVKDRMAGRVFPRDRVYIQRRVWIQSLTNVSSNSRRSPRRHSERLNIIFGILEENFVFSAGVARTRQWNHFLVFGGFPSSPSHFYRHIQTSGWCKRPLAITRFWHRYRRASSNRMAGGISTVSSVRNRITYAIHSQGPFSLSLSFPTENNGKRKSVKELKREKYVHVYKVDGSGWEKSKGFGWRVGFETVVILAQLDTRLAGRATWKMWHFNSPPPTISSEYYYYYSFASPSKPKESGLDRPWKEIVCPFGQRRGKRNISISLVEAKSRWNLESTGIVCVAEKTNKSPQ